MKRGNRRSKIRKRIEIDGKFYRYRRGKLVEIPPKWVGQTTSPQSIRKRPSKGPAKERRRTHRYSMDAGSPKGRAPRLEEGQSDLQHRLTRDELGQGGVWDEEGV